ncbi:CBS domain-containing protein, partial [Streptomyces kronopolitis]
MAVARDLMPPSTECVSAEESVLEAARKLTDLDVGALPICGTDNKLKGVLTDRDITVKVLGKGRNPQQTKAGELAQGEAVTIGADDSADEIFATMTRHKVRRLPVVIDGHRLVGMVALADVARALPAPQAAAPVHGAGGLARAAPRPGPPRPGRGDVAG